MPRSLPPSFPSYTHTNNNSYPTTIHTHRAIHTVRRRYKEDLGNSIVNFARLVPDGLLVFFPSYVVLRSCVDAWKGTTGGGGAGGATIWERICRFKHPVEEPRDSALFQAAIEARSVLWGEGRVLLSADGGGGGEAMRRRCAQLCSPALFPQIPAL